MNTYEIITNKIIEQLKQGKVAWRKEWRAELPKNLITKRPYSGINLLLTSWAEFENPYWLTYKQALNLGGQVKKGEHGTPIIFWLIQDEKEEIDENGKKIIKLTEYNAPILRYYTIFNLDQCEGITRPEAQTRTLNPIDEAERIINLYTDKPRIVYEQGGRAFYNPSRDILTMPFKSQFNTPEGYYSTLFHELTHSTGHEARLNRWKKEDNQNFGSEDYSKEELIAELGSAFLCADSGISNAVIENQGAYIQGWLRALQNDNKLIIHASARANHAVKYIKKEQE